MSVLSYFHRELGLYERLLVVLTKKDSLFISSSHFSFFFFLCHNGFDLQRSFGGFLPRGWRTERSLVLRTACLNGSAWEKVYDKKKVVSCNTRRWNRAGTVVRERWDVVVAKQTKVYHFSDQNSEIQMYSDFGLASCKFMYSPHINSSSHTITHYADKSVDYISGSFPKSQISLTS